MNAQPLPALPIELDVSEHHYLLSFTVAASSRLAAAEQARVMLPPDVHYIAVHSADRVAPRKDFWHVVLKVWEDA
jgi:hypothetical protein